MVQKSHAQTHLDCNISLGQILAITGRFRLSSLLALAQPDRPKVSSAELSDSFEVLLGRGWPLVFAGSCRHGGHGMVWCCRLPRCRRMNCRTRVKSFFLTQTTRASFFPTSNPSHEPLLQRNAHQCRWFSRLGTDRHYRNFVQQFLVSRLRSLRRSTRGDVRVFERGREEDRGRICILRP